MSIKPCWLLIVSLAAANGTALAACNNAIPRSTPDAAFMLHGTDGTVTHITTGLMWMRCLLGQTWAQTLDAQNQTKIWTCLGSPQVYSWQAALQAADGYVFAGYGDWRLPNKNELTSIVEEACGYPAINSVAFLGINSGGVQSSSPYAANPPNSRWIMDISDGSVYPLAMTTNVPVLLVRGGH